MAWTFGDGFDCYRDFSDAYLGASYWDSGTSASGLDLSAAGRFTGSKGMLNSGAGTGGCLVKSSGSNDTVHHINFAYKTGTTLSGTSKLFFVTLSDGTTAQCTIVVRSDGAIQLYSGNAASSTALATYTGAVAATNTWYSFECEVVINSTTGSFKVRKNGNTVDDSSTTGLNTRPGTNTYANRITLGSGTNNDFTIDDFMWRSSTSSVSWAGDLRCSTRFPASDASVTWTRSGSDVPVTPYGQSTTGSVTGTIVKCNPFVATCSGTVGSIDLAVNTGFTGNMKCTIFNDSSGTPGSILGSATPISNPVTGTNTFTFSSPPSVVQGTKYWAAFVSDTTGSFALSNSGVTGGYTNGCLSYAIVYANFPIANPSITLSNQQCNIFTAHITATTAANANMVAETAQDSASGYVFDNNVGDIDLYTIQSISGTPNSIVALITRAVAQKSDAGTRTAALILKSGITVSTGSTVVLNTTFAHLWRVDLLDPATGAAWTPTAVNNLQVGPKVIA